MLKRRVCRLGTVVKILDGFYKKKIIPIAYIKRREKRQKLLNYLSTPYQNLNISGARYIIN